MVLPSDAHDSKLDEGIDAVGASANRPWKTVSFHFLALGAVPGALRGGGPCVTMAQVGGSDADKRRLELDVRLKKWGLRCLSPFLDTIRGARDGS
jgi:hypothetical protein